MFVIISVATDTRAVGEAAALAIGGTVELEAMFAGPIWRRLHEPRPLPRPRPDRRHLDRPMALPDRPDHRRAARRIRLPVHPWQTRPAPDPHLDTADHQPIA
ncbi:MAG: hypothetical protein U0232_28720 [Thermomicrobiales bacterium]